MKRRDAHVVALADLHCGHLGAVTPPDHWYPDPDRISDPKIAQVAEVQREMYAAYMESVREYHRPDVLVVNGDIVDGPGRLTAGAEHITTDIETQCRMAAELLAAWEARKVILTYGTPYHTAIEGQDVEKFIAGLLAAEGFEVEIHSHAFFRVHGRVFDVRHFATRATLPHTRMTPLAREWLVNMLWAARQEQPRAHIILRAHLHSFAMAGGPDWLGFFQPCWLAAMTRYGARQCSSVVDVGLLAFQISPTGAISWSVDIKKLRANVRVPTEIGIEE